MLHFARKTLSFFDREEDSSVVTKASFSFDFRYMCTYNLVINHYLWIIFQSNISCESV